MIRRDGTSTDSKIQFEKLIMGKEYCIKLEHITPSEILPTYGMYFGIRTKRKETVHFFMSMFPPLDNDGYLSIYTAPVYNGSEGNGLCKGSLEHRLIDSDEKILVLHVERRWRYEKHLTPQERTYAKDKINKLHSTTI